MTTGIINANGSTCDGCGGECYPWANPCMSCVRARHRGAVTHKCSCGRLRRPSKLNRVGSRTWISCLRCFATIKQLS
jgi:hypothetical protein